RKALARHGSPLEIECHDGAEVLHLRSRKRMLRVSRQPRVVHAGNGRVGGQEFGNALCAGALRLIAHEVGLQAAQNEERRVRVERAADYTEVGAQAANQLASPDDGATHDVPGAGGVLGQAVDIQVDVVFAMLVESGKRVV